MRKIHVGCNVLYRMQNENEGIVDRPGVVTCVHDVDDGTVNLIVFLDGPNDLPDGRSYEPFTTMWRGTVWYSDEKADNTWHWPGS